MPVLSQIWVFPIKSLGGFRVNKWTLQNEGLLYDRQWMLVDEAYRFLTQRQLPQLTGFVVEQFSLDANEFSVLHTKNRDRLALSLKENWPNKVKAQVWDDTVLCYQAPSEVNDWFSNKLGIPVRLLRKVPEEIRQVDKKYAEEGTSTSLSDGYPVLVVSESSLQLIFEKTKLLYDPRRFRANLILDGLTPHEEDSIEIYSFGQAQLKGVKPCARCLVTTLDPDSGLAGKEPLLSLSKYRRQENKLLFGMNCLVIKSGDLTQGMEVFVSMNRKL